MSLNDVVDHAIGLVHSVNSEAADRVQAIVDAQDKTPTRPRLEGLIKEFHGEGLLQGESSSWPVLIASHFALGLGDFKHGRVEQARVSFKRAAVYGLLLGDSRLRTHALEAVQLTGDSDDHQEPETRSPQPSESLELLGSADKKTGHESEDSGSNSQSDQHYSWTSPQLSTEPQQTPFGSANPVPQVLASFKDSVNQITQKINKTYRREIKPALGRSFEALSEKMNLAADPDINLNEELREANGLIQAANSPTPPSPQDLAKAHVERLAVLAQHGHSKLLSDTVNATISDLRNFTDHSLAGRTLILCHHELRKVKPASQERERLLREACSQYKEASDDLGVLESTIEYGLEQQRVNQFDQAINIFRNVAIQARRLSKVSHQEWSQSLPHLFTRACILYGDCLGEALQRGKRPNVRASREEAANAYLQGVTNISQDACRSDEYKKTLALCHHRLAYLLQNDPDIAEKLSQSPEAHYSRARTIMESIESQ